MLSSRSLQRAERRDEGTGILSIEPQWKSWEREREISTWWNKSSKITETANLKGRLRPQWSLCLMHLDVMTLKSRRLVSVFTVNHMLLSDWIVWSGWSVAAQTLCAHDCFTCSSIQSSPYFGIHVETWLKYLPKASGDEICRVYQVVMSHSAL